MADDEHQALYGGYRCAVCGGKIVLKYLSPNHSQWIHEEE